MYGKHRRHRRRSGFGVRGRFFGPGEVRLALLSLLAEGPRHGYELMRQLEERSDGAYRASAGTIYPTLQQLEDEGLAIAVPDGGKKVYQLTDAGHAELEAEREKVERIWRRAERWGDWSFAGDPEASEIGRPLWRLAREAFRAIRRSHGDPDVVDAVIEKLGEAREAIEDLNRPRRRDRD